MYAAGRKRTGHTILVVAAALACIAGCSSTGGGDPPPAVDPSLIERSDSTNTERPAFYVQWTRASLTGLTQRPTIDRAQRMPEYPRSAVRTRAAGTTSLEVCVTAEGKLVDVKVKGSSGSPVLDEATVEWAKTAKYLPAKFNDEPFAVCGYTLDWVWQYSEDQAG